MKLLKSLSVLASTVLLGSFAAAYVQEDFDYPSPGSAAGQSGGLGFDPTAWSFSSVGIATESTVAGLQFSGLATSGNAVLIEAFGGGNTGTLARPWGNSTPGISDLWISYLIKQDGDVDITEFAGGTVFGTRFQDGGVGGFTKYATDSKFSGGFSAPYQIRGGIGSNPDAVADFSLADDVVYLFLAKFGNINYGAFTGNTTTIDIYLFNQAAFNNLTTAGIIETNLASNASVTASFSNQFEFGTLALNPADALALTVSNGAATFDSIRAGANLSDVIVVPEPGSAGMLTVLAALGLCGIRRR
ncbi:MAG: hypothetical protein ACFCU4_01335 [Puniceicoccaceae bacterium]